MTRSRRPAIPRAIALKDRFIFKTEMDDEARPAPFQASCSISSILLLRRPDQFEAIS
jgi:hypothetical protein